MSTKDHLVRPSELDASEEFRVSHPLNDQSEIFMTRLSDRAGLTHLGVSIARIPPGKESFALHVHSVNEEWIYVLSGEGQVRFDDEELALRPGDFCGFPPNGPAHLVRNTSTVDLVLLQGGDRRPGDRGRFPELGLVTYQHDDSHVALVPEDQIEIRPFSDWMKDD
ncbi:Cupin domain protein [Enhygromyxa salina]|uniref:Cupin domain protein n=1 Tax=Enhygromyxa salina TaxID=215803 RepID=A0A2S9XJ98_9BACT|nr:cupin domain-containing protein [Enhygromyxa salina]PRP92810.1 Cupin domain protein [Enhygromyxa salina]